MNDPAAVSVRSLSFSYKTRDVLHGLSFSIPKACIFALLGPNGSGKTTLFRILSTLVAPPPGSVFLHGLDAASEASAIRWKTGVVFQHPALDKKLRVGENLRCGGNLFGLHGKDLESRIERQAAAMGFADRLKEPVEQLSGGLQRRVEIAKALLPEPELLILDEPSTGLDPGARAACWDIFRGLQKDGVTILLTTHLMEEAELADRAAILHNGELVADGPPRTLCESLGEQLLILRSHNPSQLLEVLPESHRTSARITGNEIRIPGENPAALAAQLSESHGGVIESITITRPSLADVFAQRTGITLAEAEHAAEMRNP